MSQPHLHRRAARLGAISLLVAPALLATAAPPAAAPAPDAGARAALDARAVPQDRAQAEFVPGTVLVTYTSVRPSATARTEALRRVRATVARTLVGGRVELWTLGAGVAVERAIADLDRAGLHPEIESIEPNWYMYAHDAPNDPLLGELWGLHNIGQTGGVEDADVDALEAWATATGSASIVVGVIDTGIDLDHEDLAAHIWTNPLETAGNGVDDDGNGFVDDVHGWDFVNDDNEPDDDEGHGSHTAGTVGAVGDNGVGVVGVCQAVTLMPLKFLDGFGRGSTDDAIAAIDYAASFEDGAGGKVVRITSNSWGGGRRSNALKNAIQASGALFVASAGNNGNSQKQYPAGYGLENTIAVAATDHADVLAGFSSYGDWVDLAAPGVNTLSCRPGNLYDYLSGTSMAAPHVSGAAALLLADDPSLSVTALKAALLETVDPVPALAGLVATGGRLNVAAALGGGAPPPPADTTPPSAVGDLAVVAATTATSVTLTWTAPGDDGASGTAYLYDVRRALAPIESDADFDAAVALAGEPSPSPAGTQETFVATELQSETTHHFALRTTDEAGNVSSVSNWVSETTPALPPTAWTTSIVDPDAEGTYIGAALDSSGAPAVAYSGRNDEVRFASYEGSDAWTIEVVDTSNPGIDLVLEPILGTPMISHGWGKLYFNERLAGAWSRETVQPNSRNDDTVIGINGDGNPVIAARRGGKLSYAERSGGAWLAEVVDNAAARYVDIAFDSAGNPIIAYCDDPDGDGWLSAVKLAWWDRSGAGTGWAIELVEEGAVGYGVHVSIAMDPTAVDTPVLFHQGGGTGRVVRWNGTSWDAEEMQPPGSYVFGAAIAFGADGTAYLAWGDGATGVLFAHRAPGATEWTREVVASAGFPFALPMEVRSDGRIFVAFDAGAPVAVAWRDKP